MTRQARTPRQRAQAALDVEERRVKKLGTQRDKVAAELAQLTAAHEAAVRRRDHLKQHPDLQPPSTKAGAPRG